MILIVLVITSPIVSLIRYLSLLLSLLCALVVLYSCFTGISLPPYYPSLYSYLVSSFLSRNLYLRDLLIRETAVSTNKV